MGRKKRGGGRNPVGETSGVAPVPPPTRAAESAPSGGPADALAPALSGGFAAADGPAPVTGSGSGSGSDSRVDVDYSKIALVMRGSRFGPQGIYHNEIWYNRSEYYKVCMKNDEFVAIPLCDSNLVTLALGSCSMHTCKSRIYNISCFPSKNMNKIPDTLPVDGESLHCHSGISWVDLNQKRALKKWHSGVRFQVSRSVIHSAVFGTKIYCLHSYMTMTPKVYDTLVDKFTDYKHQLPTELLEWKVDPKIIPQPRKNRILVHLHHPDHEEPPALYAWHPTTNHWDFITAEIDMHTWNYRSPILIDGILFFFSHLCPPHFAAFNVGSAEWVKVKWSTHPIPDAVRVKADTILYLGNGLVCLPSSFPIFDQDIPPDELPSPLGTCVHFHVFHIRKTYSSADGPVFVFTHLFTKRLDMDNIARIEDYLTPF